MYLVIAVLVALIFIVYGLLLILFVLHWRKIKTFSPKKNHTYTTTVTILIATRNEALTITNLLNALAAQVFPATLFEVIIVDDYSEDSTVKTVQDYIAASALKIKIIELKNVPAALQNKKGALTEGIKQATGALIITTDADCTMGPNWLCAIVEYYEIHKPDFIAAPVQLNGNSVLECLQVVEFLSLMVFTGASISLKKPLMCNGANLAYPKHIFNQLGGFDGNILSASGDDTFLMFKIWKQNKQRIHFLKSTEAIVHTKAQTTFFSLFNQRIRWASKTKNYHLNHISQIGFLIVAANVSVLFLALISLFNFSYFKILIAILVFKMVMDSMLLIASNSFFKTKKLTAFNVVLLTLVYPIYLVTIALLKSRKFSWKGRSYRASNY